MESTKYVGLDVHKEATTVAVMNSAGKLIMESIIETKAVTIRQFIQGLRGDLHVTFEEGTWANSDSPSLFSVRYHLPPFIAIRMTPT